MKKNFATDTIALAFLVMAVCYLLAGLFFGIIGSFQYVLPEFLNQSVPFQKTRPLHVYLVISWIFTSAQGCIYYFIPRVCGREIYWKRGVWLHFYWQLAVSCSIVIAFFSGWFGGREYLEFPPWLGAAIILSWVPFAINFFHTLKIDYKTAPVYIWSWSVGILFFFITMSESYLWLFDYFNKNLVRDLTVQWKGLGSMVGSWNMLVYGTALYVMEKISGDRTLARKPISFFFFFLGLTNLMFNWGHHTYIVPAAPWVKNISYFISMTELLIFGNIIYQWRKTLSIARKNFHFLPQRLLSIGDAWIFLNLALAILMSVPAINFFTHGTHITVAHSMGATIGINTMLMFGALFYIIRQQRPLLFSKYKKGMARAISLANVALIVFWSSLLGSGVVKILGQSNQESFASIMKKSLPFFELLTASGIFIFLAFLIVAIRLFKMIFSRQPIDLVDAATEAAALTVDA